ncbi:MAG: DNA alkylation repair protein [Lewinellaceae bacterium]|nr:DNA alkylation repair protein [Lewinellaceae bacterium]
MSPSSYFEHVRDRFRENGNPDIAQMQMWYMRHQFDYFGLKMPQWMALTKEIHKKYGLPAGEDLKMLARLCFEDDRREMQYFALETVQKTLKEQPPEFIDFLEELILTKSWWDTVDWIAKLAGLHFRRFPEMIRPVTGRWMESGNMWLQRVSMIFQLMYKEKTDANLMFDYIRRLSGSKEFFIQKGAGWALRQYSKTAPDVVRDFVESAKLAALTKREGLKWLKKTGL